MAVNYILIEWQSGGAGSVISGGGEVGRLRLPCVAIMTKSLSRVQLVQYVRGAAIPMYNGATAGLR